MENIEKGLTVPEQVLLVWPKIPPRYWTIYKKIEKYQNVAEVFSMCQSVPFTSRDQD